MTAERDPLPRAEPGPDPPHDPHTPPLDDPDDARWLKRGDPRRVQVEQDRGQEFPGNGT